MTRNIPILMYHEIYRNEERERLKGLTNPAYNTELTLFRRQMAGLLSSNVKTVTLNDLHSQESHPEARTICLTFDDGWLGNYLYVYPILKEFGFKGTFFVATGLIGKSSYMKWEHLKEMQASGMSIQSHTVTHRPLASIGGGEVRVELLHSKRIIEEKLGEEVHYLSLPHGSKNGMTWPMAKEIGYKSICTSDVGFHRAESTGPWLKRIAIGDGISEKRFQRMVQGEKRAIWDMMISKRVKNLLRGIIGMGNYRKLYRMMYDVR